MKRKQTTRARHGALCAAMAALPLVLASPPALAQARSAAEPVRIGGLFSTTGGLAAVGQAEREGALLAQKVINARGGINGRPLEMMVEDDGSSPDSAVAKANALLHTHKVRAIIGPSGIAQTVAIGGITQAQKVPLFAFSGLGPAVERERTCVFHLTPSQELNARAVLAYARDNGLKRVGVLHDSGYGQVVWSSMKTLDRQYGVSFVQVEKFEIAATDVTTQAAKLKAAAPDAIVVISTSPAPFRNVRQLKIGAPIIAVHGTATYETVKGMGEAADNIIHPEFIVSEDPLPAQKEFVEAYRKEYGKLPKHFAAVGWDAVMALANGLKTAGADAAGDKLCGALRRPYQGVTTGYDFAAPDMGGMTLAGFTYSKLQKGQFVRLDYKPRP
ncbi:ABC transporter substrate-binding protein [Cupriavidus sp. MP-37]|uniref:ABC transporter substrate-binding protein n=1 Tax=Cupriavidus sp. MP-37 TaxID=2884455 RepID=UPI001D0AEF68|nr:ABC transporter substrate-binding protein [Cupriavidus sp. MP-37]UDM52683.1 ABC transporter substrate-binding protein [Cupriavidus sp. MP-37]